MQKTPLNIEDFFFLKINKMWLQMRAEHFSFWMLCAYLFFEYWRPQSLYPAIAFLPWAKLFLIFALVGAFTDKSVKWVKSPVNVLISLFALLILISSFTAYYPESSRKHWIDFYSWYVIYFLIINIVNTKNRFYIFLMVFIISAAKIAIGTSRAFAFRGFSFSSWGLSGPPGYFENSGELAILMLTLLPITIFFYRHFRHKVSRVERYILLLFSITPVLTVLGASSRGSQIAMAIQLAIMFRKSLFKIKPLIGVIVLASALYALLPDAQKSRFESTGEDTSSQQRLLYWKHGWDMMTDNPMLGVGFFNFVPYYDAHFPGDILYGTAQLPHNIFVQVGTDMGFVGLILFIAMIFYCFYSGWVASRDTQKLTYIRCALIGNAYGVLGFAIAGQFVTVTYYPFFWIGLGFIVAAKNIMAIEAKHKIDESLIR